MSALSRFKTHSHTGDIVVDNVDDVLVAPFICCDQTEIIGIRESDCRCGVCFCVKFVTMFFF